MKKTKFFTRIFAVLAICAMVFTSIPADNTYAAYTGMGLANGNWVYYTNGVIDTTYTGPAANEFGWWYMTNGQIDFTYNGMQYINGNWWYFKNGALDWHYTGLAYNEFGWWYFYNGGINYEYKGLVANEFGWWYVENGAINWNYTGLACNEYGWWYVTNGALDWNYTGMACNEYGWWYVKNGALDPNYTGMACNDFGWWYFTQGTLNLYYTGIATNEFGTWFYTDGRLDLNKSAQYNNAYAFKDDKLGWVVVSNGQLVKDYTGIAYNEYKPYTWYFENGKMVENYTGMCLDSDRKTWRFMKNGDIDVYHTGLEQKDGVWYFYKDGVIDWKYTGIAHNTSGAWYVKNGKVDTSFTGTYKDNTITYQVTKGSAKAISAPTMMLGVFFNSRSDTTDTLFASYDGDDFTAIGTAYENAVKVGDGSNGTVEDNTATCSTWIEKPTDPIYQQYYGNVTFNTLHDPSILYDKRNKCFWTVGGMVDANTGAVTPLMGYSRDLVHWSYPSAGTNTNGTRNTGLKPASLVLDANGNYTKKDHFDAVAVDAMMDDDGSIWFLVSLGYYGDSHSNKLAQYIIHCDSLSIPSNSLTTVEDKIDAYQIDYTMNYISSGWIKMDIPSTTSYDDKGNPLLYDYDGSLYKQDGVYYFVTQHSGEDCQIWKINDLNKAGDKKAWTLINESTIEGSEGPFITFNNGKYYQYTDRYAEWEFHDYWDNTYGIFASTSDTLYGKPFAETARITTHDKNGTVIPARHGTVITLTDPEAIAVVKDALNNTTFRYMEP